MQTDPRPVIHFCVSALITLLLVWVLNTSFGMIPPLGPFFSPATGFWANAEISYGSDQEFTLPESLLGQEVSVYYDELQIPHIFASNSYDLYFAQGFITARDRLWQMEFQTHAAAGRLSEIVGERTLEYDRYRRRIGMTYAAERALEGMNDNPETLTALRAYSDGVNAWIDRLDPSEYPLEYKILDYRPEPWSPFKSALLLKYMTFTLAGSHNDLRMSNTRAVMGDEFIDRVLDLEPELNDPIIPAGKSWNFEPIEVKEPSGSFVPRIVQDLAPFQPDPANGSNNWAVSGNKTAGGYPVLANDPHLNMTLPSIWYAVQLHSEQQNVMGATLPGTPAVIIGFNEHIAWGTTNVSADVWDWYEITFKDSTLKEYRYDHTWRETDKRIEIIKVRGQVPVIDTVTYTHHGPVVEDYGTPVDRSSVPKLHALRWIAHEKSNEMQHFLLMNKARDYEDYREALRYFQSPAQNWVFADRSNIALTVTGKYPLKWHEQGRYISDGSDPDYEWQDWIPFEQIPSVKNPDRGFVSSANQDPTANTYPYYLDDDFAPFERGRRINERLAGLQDITADDMRRLQLDNFSYHAHTALPVLLDHLKSDTLPPQKLKYARLLEEWNYFNEGDLIAPSLFHRWWEHLYNAIWADEYGSAGVPMKWPARDQVVQLMKDRPDMRWYDNILTDKKETLTDLINDSFHSMLRQMENEFGPDNAGWKWGYVNKTGLDHLGQIPGLGIPDLFTSGAGESVNAIRGDHGPSWRMVVELGPQMKAHAIYPGGQSGNPGSKYYDSMVDQWNEGMLHPLWFMRDRPDQMDSLSYTVTLQ